MFENQDSTSTWMPDERLLAAARSDNEDMLLEVFGEGNFDINAQDGCVYGAPVSRV